MKIDSKVCYTFEDLIKLHKWNKFFKYGFYISLIIWMCGICFVTFSGGTVAVKLIVIAVTLGIYVLFVIGKSITETMLRKGGSMEG